MSYISESIFQTSGTSKFGFIEQPTYQSIHPIVNFLELILINQLSNPNFNLKKPIRIEVDIEDEGYLFSSYSLNVHSFGHTYTEALEEFEACLINIYRSYRNTPDLELTKGGKVLKDKLSEIIEEK